MWQRVQTLYLGIATLLIAALFWSDVAKVVLEDGFVEHLRYTADPAYLFWLIVLTVLQVLSLGGFRWRMRQLRVVIVTAIMCLAFQGFLVYDYIKLHDVQVFSWTVLFPFVSFVLDCCGARNIMLDEAIVQSANRLRRPRNKKR